jgi:hypothetical protein
MVCGVHNGTFEYDVNREVNVILRNTGLGDFYIYFLVCQQVFTG